MIFLWICTAIGACGGGVMLLSAIFSNPISAPQQAALAAMGVGCAVIPYVFTRAIDCANEWGWRAQMLKQMQSQGAGILGVTGASFTRAASRDEINAARARLVGIGVKFTQEDSKWRVETRRGSYVTNDLAALDAQILELDARAQRGDGI